MMKYDRLELVTDSRGGRESLGWGEGLVGGSGIHIECSLQPECGVRNYRDTPTS